MLSSHPSQPADKEFLYAVSTLFVMGQHYVVVYLFIFILFFFFFCLFNLRFLRFFCLFAFGPKAIFVLRQKSAIKLKFNVKQMATLGISKCRRLMALFPWLDMLWGVYGYED